MYDPKCEELAKHFLEDEPELRHGTQHLAQEIQDAIEDWIVEHRHESQYEP